MATSNNTICKPLRINCKLPKSNLKLCNRTLNNGNINNQTNAIVSPTTNVIALAHFGPQSEGAIPANNMASNIPLL